ncbi:MAG: PPK2 family polyphosphate kinase [Bacteriovoracia bacterium]
MKIKLRNMAPDDTGKFKAKEEAASETEALLEEMYRLMYLMFAEDRRSLLIILQGIDASGKDGTIRHIFSGANPQGIRVYSFKQPSEEELRHDFLWRCQRLAPERGSVAIFNRSYYEDVTTVKVHPEYLEARRLPLGVKPAKIFSQRFAQINDYEKMLSENGTTVLKFFLHISKEEQKERLEERLVSREKNWKFSVSDIKDREYWGEYRKAFEEMMAATSTKHSPWHIIPADKKWYRNYLVTKLIVNTLSAHAMSFPRAKHSKIKIV